MSESKKLVAYLRQIGFDVEIQPMNYTERFRGLAPAKDFRERVDVGCHFLFDADGKLVALESEYDGWVTSVSTEAINVSVIVPRTFSTSAAASWPSIFCSAMQRTRGSCSP